MSGELQIALIIGMGSAGLRHARILKNMGHKIIFVTKGNYSDFECYASLEAALLIYKPDYVIIANETYKHYSTLKILLQNFKPTKLLIEKPLFHEFLQFSIDIKQVYIAYQLRFDPTLMWLMEKLKGKRIIQAQIYVGQYLPLWRPVSDYAKTYSASRKMGGGVLKDLSHELDYVLWLFGACKQLVAIGGHYSDLEIDSDDSYAIMMETERCKLVTIQMNYLDKISRREVTVTTSDETYFVDIKNRSIKTSEKTEIIPYNKEEATIGLHTAILGKEVHHACTFNEGLNLLNLIENIEKSALIRKWVFI